MAQVFVSKSGSNIGCHVAQIFIDIHISYLYHNVRQKVWQCSDRFKGKKGNGCNNEIISEEDLIILLSETLGVPYNGLDNLNPDDYECIYKVTIYKNGEIQLEYK